jgi:hypothetical protein
MRSDHFQVFKAWMRSDFFDESFSSFSRLGLVGVVVLLPLEKT